MAWALLHVCRWLSPVPLALAGSASRHRLARHQLTFCPGCALGARNQVRAAAQASAGGSRHSQSTCLALRQRCGESAEQRLQGASATGRSGHRVPQLSVLRASGQVVTHETQVGNRSKVLIADFAWPGLDWLPLHVNQPLSTIS